MKIIRVICYESEDLEALNNQMAHSLPDTTRGGVRGVMIQVRTVVDERPKIDMDIVNEEIKRVQANSLFTTNPSVPSFEEEET